VAELTQNHQKISTTTITTKNPGRNAATCRHSVVRKLLDAEKLNFWGLRQTALDRVCGSPKMSDRNESSKLGLLKRVIPGMCRKVPSV
jgi:hypothetical protein